jgi:VWFA-related protein
MAADTLIVHGLSELMTGWHRLEAKARDRAIARVGWRLNGRNINSSDPFAADVYFGVTPQPRHLEVLAYDERGRLQFTKTTSVNAGGRARVLDFLYPVEGASLAGHREIGLCVASPADRPIETVTVAVDAAGASTVSARALRQEKRACPAGELWTATLPFSGEAATLTAQLFTRDRRLSRALGTEEVQAAIERSILINMPPALNETVDVRLLEWPVHVYQGRRLVTELEPTWFELLEDRLPCAIRAVHQSQDVPLRIALVFDWTASTVFDRPAEARSAIEFLERLFDAQQDSVSIWVVADTPIRYLDWTYDEGALGAALERISVGHQLSGGTAFYDTLGHALYSFQTDEADGVPVVIVMSDGLDTRSDELSGEQVLAYARESGVRVYPISVRTRLESNAFTAVDTPYLEALAHHTGGSTAMIELRSDTQEMAAEIAALRRQATSLRENPGELSEDPRFLSYLIAESENKAAELETTLARRQKSEESSLSQLRDAFEHIDEQLRSGFVLIASGRAPRSDRWHDIEVRLRTPPARGVYDVRAAPGVYW